ncbi:uncharacterized protein LOC143281474 [Babylonia areolata]|uniref:uncharacterized protein LOC143281474 n=1 Tax=Babylonia areolata TaxID=304850 RepID=UPI003FCEF3E2
MTTDASIDCKGCNTSATTRNTRVDRGFNPDRATVCSRHFTDSCFRYGPTGVRSLIPGSLPTEFMPYNLQVSGNTKTTPTKTID